MPWLPLHLTHHSLDDKAGRQPGPGKVRKYSLSYSESCHLSLASYLPHCSPPSLCCSFPGCCSTLSLSASAVLQAGPGVLYGCGATKPGPGPHDVTHCSSWSPPLRGPAPPTSSLQSWLSSPLSFLHTPIQIKIMAHWKIYF